MALKDGTHTETTNVDGLYKNSDKKAVADKYIELLQMGCFASNTTVRFRLGHNFSIDALLEDPNPSYSLKQFDTDITHDKIQSTDTVIAVWWWGGYSRTGNVRGNRIDHFGLKGIQTSGSGSSAITD